MTRVTEALNIDLICPHK